MEEEDERWRAAGIGPPEGRQPAAYSITVAEAPAGVSVLVLRGELDLAAAPLLRARVDEAASGRGLVVDLSETTFIDSSVLKELLSARARLAARGGRLVLAGVPLPVRRLLDLTRTSELFDRASGVEAAVRRLLS